MGGMWIGLVDGTLMGIVGQQIDTASDTVQTPCPGPDQLPGLAGRRAAGRLLRQRRRAWRSGLTGSVLLRNRAPTYGRVAMIQSAALGGAFAGALAQLAFRWQPYGAAGLYNGGTTTTLGIRRRATPRR